jgi:hypothetical protein
MKEIGSYRMPDADTWAAKTPRIDRRTGDFHLYGNDLQRGLDIYRFNGAAAKPKSRGRWMSAEEADVFLAGRTLPGVSGTSYVCLLDD